LFMEEAATLRTLRSLIKEISFCWTLVNENVGLTKKII